MSDHAHRLNVSAGMLSSTVALSLVALKLWALGETGALSIAASLADSALDLIVSIAGLLAIVWAAKPADDDHAFGHTSAEDIAALGQSLFIAVSAIVIAAAAVLRLINGGPPLAQEGRGIAVMVISVMMTLSLVAWQTRVARRTGNSVVQADRLHYLGDLIPGIGAILSLWVSRAYGLFAIDAVVAIGTAGFLLAGAAQIGKPAFDALMDRAASAEMIAGIETIAAAYPGVHGFHDLKTRTAGSKVFVNLHIELDGDQTLNEAHEIGAGLRREILKTYPMADVIIHKDPLGQPEEDPVN